MSSQIPNLLSSRGGPRSRGRGRGRGGSSQQSPSSRRDQVIQATDTDAAVSRLSAVSLGYLDDPFAQYFVSGTGTRRLPIINRGTYTRTTALDILINAFTADSSPTQPKQIVSLGAGTDTRYFRLLAQNRTENLFYHEYDFPTVCEAKFRILEANQNLIPNHTLVRNKNPEKKEEDRAIGLGDEEGWRILSDGEAENGYFCHPLDLRNLPSKDTLYAFEGLRADIPTLVISECCLCYLEVDTARDVIKWFSALIPSVGIILYEPIGVNDAFGQMMVENLAARGIVMPTVQRYKGLGDQGERLREAGFGGQDGGVAAVTIENVWDKWIEEGERERVDGLEGLDEVEEWQMLARHYAVVWGWRGNGWEGWKSLKLGGAQ